MKMTKSQMRAGIRGAKKGRRAGRDGVPQFMIAPCQSANERTPLLFIEITSAIDGRAGIETYLLHRPISRVPYIYYFCSTHSCQATIINLPILSEI